METELILLIILSSGFTLLVIFVCVALLTMIRIMTDVQKITQVVRRETENIGSLVDTVTTKTKSFLVHSLVADKIVPAVLGILSVAIGARKAHTLFNWQDEDEEEQVKSNIKHKRK